MSADPVQIGIQRMVSQQDLRTKTGDGKDLVVVSGYAEIKGTDLMGNADGTWNRRVLLFRVGPDWRILEDIVPVVSMTSIMNVDVATNAGWAVDDCRPIVSDVQIKNVLYAQLECRVAVRDRDGFMFRVNFYVTMLGVLA